MGNAQSELQTSLTKLPSLYNNPTEFKHEIYNFVASVPLSTPLPVKCDGKKLVDVILKVLRDEYAIYMKQKGANNADLLMCINAFTRLCKIKQFYCTLHTCNITVLIDMLKLTDNDILQLAVLQCLSYVLDCRVSITDGDKKKWTEGGEREQSEEKNKIAVFESNGYTQLLTVLQQQFIVIEQNKAGGGESGVQQVVNYDILCSVLDILSLDLVDHMNTSRYIIIQTILTGLKNHWDTLLGLTVHSVRSPEKINVKLLCYSSLLLQGLMIHSTIDRCAALQNKILYDGYVLYYLLYSIDMQNVQQYVSTLSNTSDATDKYKFLQYYSQSLTGLTRNLLSLITTNHSWNQEIIFRSLPQPLWASTYAQINAPARMNHKQPVELDKRVSKEDKKSLESTLLYAYTTGKIARIDWHPIFISLDKTHNNPILMWTVHNKIELLHSVYNEMDHFEVTKSMHGKSVQCKYNYAAYDMQYKSMHNYLRVNQYYVSCLTRALNNPKTTITQKITSEIVPLLIQLFQQLCIELSVNWRVGLLRSVRAVHTRFGLLKGSFKHIQIIQYLVYSLNDCFTNIDLLSKQATINDGKSSSGETRTKLQEYLLLRDYSFDFLLSLLHDPLHIATYLQQPNSVQILIQYINAVHTLDWNTVVQQRTSFLVEFIASLSQVKIANNQVTLARANQKLTDINNEQPAVKPVLPAPAATVPAADGALSPTVNEPEEKTDDADLEKVVADDAEEVVPYQTEREDLCAQLSAPRDVLSTSEYALAVLILLSRGGAKSKKLVSTFKVVQTLVKLQVVEATELKQVSCQFLLELLDDSLHYVPTLYSTGVWPLVVYAWQFSVLPQHIELVDKYHNKQLLNGTTQSALLSLFPSPLIQYLNQYGAQRFLELVQSDSVQDSNVIWTHDMYVTLLNTVATHVQPFIELLKTKPNSTFKYDTATAVQVVYAQLEASLCIHNTYIDTFNQSAATDLDSLQVNDPITFLTELSAYQSSSACTSDQLLSVLQCQVYLVKKYTQLLEQTTTYTYDIRGLIELLRQHASDDAAHHIQEKTIELIHHLLATKPQYCDVIFDMKGVDTIIDYTQRTIDSIDSVHETDNRKQATSYIPLLYYLLHTLAVMCSKHQQTLKHVEYTPALVSKLCQLLNDKYSQNYPNATMAVCKCLYVFVQNSDKLNGLIGQCGGLLYLVQLVLYYDAPAHLKYRQAVGEKTTADQAKQQQQQQNPIDWTNKIKLGTTYVLNTMLKQESYAQPIKVLQTLLTGELCTVLHDKPSDFVKLINNNTQEVQTVKRRLSPYIETQVQQINDSNTHQWQQYVDKNVSVDQQH